MERQVERVKRLVGRRNTDVEKESERGGEKKIKRRERRSRTGRVKGHPASTYSIHPSPIPLSLSVRLDPSSRLYSNPQSETPPFLQCESISLCVFLWVCVCVRERESSQVLL